LPKARKRRIFLEPPRLKFDFIRQKAEEFRRNYVKPIDMVPVPVYSGRKRPVIPVQSGHLFRFKAATDSG